MQTTDWHGCYRQGWGELMANPDAFSHPAKNSRNLARRIYEHGLERGYFQRGQMVLDPFAGVGGFAFHAMRFGMHFVGVELEQRFVDYASGYDCPGFGKAFFRRFWHRLDRLNYKLFHLCPACVRALKADDFGGVVPSQGAHRYQGNIELWNERYAAHFPRWGSAVIVQGDSRRLGEVLVGRVSGMVGSPPYAESITGSHKPQDDIARALRSGHTLASMRKPGGQLRYAFDYGPNPSNLGNLPAGELGAVLVTSPPYAAGDVSSDGQRGIDKGDVEKTTKLRKSKRLMSPDGYGTTPGQLAALPPGTVNAALTSPPYAASLEHKGGIDSDKSEHVGGPHSQMNRSDTRYGAADGQLGILPPGSPDAVLDGCVSSPPYADGCRHTGGDDPKPEYIQGGTYHSVGISGAVSSPPYAASTASDDPDKRGGLFRDSRRRGDKTLTATYGESEEQLGGMVEGCVSSPPYAEAQTGGGIAITGTPKTGEFSKTGGYRTDMQGTTPGQLGNQQNETFWTAAKQVVQQLHQVLAPGAYAIFVTKRFVRDKKIVEFSEQWMKLCEACGFELVERIRAWLVEERGTQLGLWGEDENKDVKRVSFFRRLHSQKYPHLSIDWEDVLIFRKVEATPHSLPCGNCGTYRTVNQYFEVKDCPNCGDDGFSLCDEGEP